MRTVTVCPQEAMLLRLRLLLPSAEKEQELEVISSVVGK